MLNEFAGVNYCTIKTHRVYCPELYLLSLWAFLCVLYILLYRDCKYIKVKGKSVKSDSLCMIDTFLINLINMYAFVGMSAHVKVVKSANT